MSKRTLGTFFTITLLFIFLPAQPAFSAGIGVGEDNRTATVKAQITHKEQQRSAVNRLIEQSKSGTTPAGVTPLTPEQIADIQRARNRFNDWVRLVCIPTFSDGNTNESVIREMCRSLGDEPGSENLPGAGPTPAQVRIIASEIAKNLTVPRPTPHIGPDPSLNQWNIAAVGFAYWLWTDPTRTMDATRTEQGVTVTLHAVKTSTTFSMGDGNTVECATTTPWSKRVEANKPSPTCGYVYTKSSGKGTYTFTATDHWTVTWTADGETGTMTLNPTESTELNVKELQTVIR